MVRIVEGKLPYTGGTGIGIDTNKVISLLLREENNLIMVNGDNEIYTDLQLATNIEPTDEFPVGVTVGKVLAEDGWDQNGLILNRQTTSGDYARWLYGADGKIYFDGGQGTWKQVYYSDEVDALFTAFRNELATVAFTGDYNDLRNRPDLSRQQSDWDQIDTTAPDYIKNKPTIGDATLNLAVNNNIQTVFTANDTDNATFNVTVPTKTSDITNDGDGTNVFVTKTVNNLDNYTLSSALATVATSGSYADLSNKPTIGSATLTIQKNSTDVATFGANATSNVTANITVPTVIDSLSSTDTTNSLSAAQGKVLNDKIEDLQALGKFLSLWDSSTGQPISFPLTTPYTYHTGDYYLVQTVSTATPAVDYRPNGSSYTGTASTTVETDEIEVGDLYIYDGTNWLLQINHGKTVSFANLAGQPTDNAALATALGNKANDNAVVKLTGNQTVAGTKTFSTSPVVPSKTSDATNSGTAIATEAQVYKKQDALTAQTAYTSKGSATKVPQITTNTLGQVTGITEVTITHPSQVDDTAYASSWDGVTTTAPSKNAVYDKISAMDTTIAGKQNTLTAGTGITISGNTISATASANTTTFYLAGTSSSTDIAKAQEIYDYYAGGNNPIVVYGGKEYILYSANSTSISFKSLEVLNSSGYIGSDDQLYQSIISFTLSSGTVTAISTGISPIGSYLDTGTNYSTAYTPLYDGSPATKKYVDDNSFTAAGGGVKVFAYPSVNDNISDILTWLSSGGDVILKKELLRPGDIYPRVSYYKVSFHDTDNFYIRAECFTGSSNLEAEEFTYSSNVVTSISNISKDFFVPSNSGTTDQVLTKTASGYQWATPSGGDVMVSDQANNILTSGMKIWAGTQANYEGLGTYDSNTVYLTIE